MILTIEDLRTPPPTTDPDNEQWKITRKNLLYHLPEKIFEEDHYLLMSSGGNGECVIVCFLHLLYFHGITKQLSLNNFILEILQNLKSNPLVSEPVSQILLIHSHLKSTDSTNTKTKNFWKITNLFKHIIKSLSPNLPPDDTDKAIKHSAEMLTKSFFTNKCHFREIVVSHVEPIFELAYSNSFRRTSIQFTSSSTRQPQHITTAPQKFYYIIAANDDGIHAFPMFPKSLLLSSKKHIARYKDLQAAKVLQEPLSPAISYKRFLTDSLHPETNLSPPDPPLKISKVVVNSEAIFFTVSEKPDYGNLFYGFVNKKTYVR